MVNRCKPILVVGPVLFQNIKKISLFGVNIIIRLSVYIRCCGHEYFSRDEATKTFWYCTVLYCYSVAHHIFIDLSLVKLNQ